MRVSYKSEVFFNKKEVFKYQYWCINLVPVRSTETISVTLTQRIYHKKWGGGKAEKQQWIITEVIIAGEGLSALSFISFETLGKWFNLLKWPHNIPKMSQSVRFEDTVQNHPQLHNSLEEFREFTESLQLWFKTGKGFRSTSTKERDAEGNVWKGSNHEASLVCRTHYPFSIDV